MQRIKYVSSEYGGVQTHFTRGEKGEFMGDATTREERVGKGGSSERGRDEGRRLQNAANRANCGCNTKFGIIPRTKVEEQRAVESGAALRRNGNIRTITIKSGSSAASRFRADGERRRGRR